MISREELLKKQKALGIPLSTLEKDYVLGLVLWGLSKHPVINSTWVFKGGTCIKKCYIKDYRFSEDLDFSLTPEATINPSEIRDLLVDAFQNIQKVHGLRISSNDLSISPFPDKEGLFIQVKVPFQGPISSSGSLPKIKFDLSKEELLVDHPARTSLLHDYSDSPNLIIDVLCYSLEEIFSEKLRALVERTRPRDLYDVVNLFNQYFSTQPPSSSLCHNLMAKFDHKGFIFPEAFYHLSEDKIQLVEADWIPMLKHQVPNLLPPSHFLKRLIQIKEWLELK